MFRNKCPVSISSNNPVTNLPVTPSTGHASASGASINSDKEERTLRKPVLFSDHSHPLLEAAECSTNAAISCTNPSKISIVDETLSGATSNKISSNSNNIINIITNCDNRDNAYLEVNPRCAVVGPGTPSNQPGNNSASSSGSSSIASPSTIAHRPTHRRGLSHGSFSFLNTPLSSTTTASTASASISKANTLTLGVPNLHQYATATSNYLPNVHHSSAGTSSHHFSHMHFTPTPNSAVKANSSEYLSHTDNDFSASGSAHLHANQSGTSLVSQASNTPPNDDIKRVISQIEQKIRRTKDLIKEVQLQCDDNVNEYLKLSANAEPNQSSRLRTVFENNNKKSTQKITRLQKKLKGYDEKILEIKNTGVYLRHTREKLKDGVNIITGISGGVIEGIKSGIHSAGESVIAKPKEFFKRSTNDSSNTDQSLDTNCGVICNETTTYPDLVPSDTITSQTMGQTNSLTSNLNTGTLQGVPLPGHFNHSGGALNSANSHSTKCTSDDESSTSITSGSGQIASGGNHSFNNSAYLSNSPLKMKPLLRSSNIANKISGDNNFEVIVSTEIESFRKKIDDNKDENLRLSNDLACLKNQYQNDVSLLNSALQDEKYRVDRLEEQLNDLTELHQREIENLRQTITDLEEKMLYQTEERHRDVHEMLESFQTRISRMEHQQHQHLQQLVSLDSLDNSNAQALVLKLINVLLTVLQVVLLLVATLANILSPFLHTRARIFTSVIVILFFSFVFQHWPELTIWTKQKIYEKFLYILSRLPFLSFDDSNTS